MQFAGKLETLNQYDRLAVKGWVEKFLEKQGKFADIGNLNLRLVQREMKFRECRCFIAGQTSLLIREILLQQARNMEYSSV